MNIAICDDEQIFIDKICSNISLIASKNNKKCNFITCTRGDELINICKKQKIDAIFLDIEMPGLNGFETAGELLKTSKNLILVFVSNKESMVFSSYEYRPFWFIPKTQLKLLNTVVDKIIKKIEKNNSENNFTTLNVGNKVIEICLKEVFYFKNEDHYIRYFLKDNSISESYRCKLETIEKQLEKKNFIRIHNRYLINVRAISFIENSTCVLLNGNKLPISRANVSKTKEIFQCYMRSIR